METDNSKKIAIIGIIIIAIVVILLLIINRKPDLTYTIGRSNKGTNGVIISSKKELDDLTIYAEKIGLAFQVKDDILSEEGNELITGKPVGNDKEKNKCTYVTKYGLQEAKNILNKITNEAVAIMDSYGSRGEFLKQLAIYIKDRNK